VIVTHADNPRSASTEEIREAASRVSSEIEAAADVTTALEMARAAQNDAVVVITGSIYIVGEAMRLLGARI
jgi:folylpolyglutamate synthase/dihydropteroate synthase